MYQFALISASFCYWIISKQYTYYIEAKLAGKCFLIVIEFHRPLTHRSLLFCHPRSRCWLFDNSLYMVGNPFGFCPSADEFIRLLRCDIKRHNKFDLCFCQKYFSLASNNMQNWLANRCSSFIIIFFSEVTRRKKNIFDNLWKSFCFQNENWG